MRYFLLAHYDAAPPLEPTSAASRPVKTILAGPDASGGPTEASGPARMLFTGRAREGAELVTG